MAGWAAAAAVAGAAISGGGAAQANSASARMSRQMYKRRYQYTVQDLKRAGLNPMLAVTNGAPVPNTPQVQNVGEAAVRGATSGSGAVLAAKMNQAQLGNIAADTNAKQASALAATEAANKTRIEADQLNRFGSARQTAEIDQIRQNVAESFARVAELSVRKDLGVAQLAHNEKHFPIVRELDQALADAKRAEVPLKDLIADVASSIADSLKTLSKVDGEALLKDTGNLIEDKVGNVGSMLWNTATAPYRWIDGAWTGFKDYAQRTRRK